MNLFKKTSSKDGLIAGNKKQGSVSTIGDDFSVTYKKLGDVLLQGNYLSQDDLQEALKNSKNQGKSLENYLISSGLITKDLLGQAISESFKTTYADLTTMPPSVEMVQRIPKEICDIYKVVLYKEDIDNVYVATPRPDNQYLRPELEKLFAPKNIQVLFGFEDSINPLLSLYKQPLQQRIDEIVENRQKVVGTILDEILSDAVSSNVSDIHLEPLYKGSVKLRFRIDGVLHEIATLSRENYEGLINKIKVDSLLKVDEHFSAQDGAMRYEMGAEVYDLRVSVAPILSGEKIVIRILSHYVKEYSFSDLGLSERNQLLFQQSIKKPFGMILITGPTGSGKTTTLYSFLKLLNRSSVNIMTIEDPVEYRIEGINQIQVNPATNLTFAKGLKSIVRQDPNIILVGEIRDTETAEISVNAALTGQLLFSTFHANDAAASIPRMIDLGVAPFLLASTLEIVASQRLVRKICEGCRSSHETTSDQVIKDYPEMKNVKLEKSLRFYKGKGCRVCNGTGYVGRTGIFEIIQASPAMKDLIMKNPSSNDIWNLARQEGTVSMFEDGLDKINSGITTLEELLRVAKPNEYNVK